MDDVTNDTGIPGAATPPEVPPAEPPAGPATPPAPAEGATPPEGKLLAGKYQSVDELEKAYKEAQRKITELSQRPDPGPAAEPASKEFDLRSLLEEAPAGDPPSATPQYPFLDQAAVQSMLVPIVREQKLSRLENVIEKAQRDEKFKKYEGEVIAEIKGNPILFNEWKKGNPAVIDLAYKSVQAKHIGDEVTEAISRKSKELQSISQTAPTVVGDRSATPPPPKPRSVKGEVIDAIAEGRDTQFIDDLMRDLEKQAMREKVG